MITLRLLARRLPAVTGALALAALLAPSASAQSTIYSTFGAGDTYDNTFGYVVGQDGFGGTQWLAASFQYAGPGSAELFGLRFAIGDYIGSAGTFDASFWDGTSMNSATHLESWTGLTSSVSFDPGEIQTVLSAGGQFLTPGDTYWLALSSTDGSFAWDRSLLPSGAFEYTPDTGADWLDFDGNGTLAWDVSTVSTDVTPEPATMTLFATGLVGLAATGRRKKRRNS